MRSIVSAGARAAGSALGLCGLTLASFGCGGRPAPADLVIRHARAFTAGETRPWAEAVAVRDGRIVEVGADTAMGPLIGPGTRVIDAAGRLVLPGFIDSHNHISFGDDPDVVRLGEARSFGDLLDRIRAFAAARPDLEWIEGDGWNYSVLPGGRLPTAADLEGLTGGRPAFLVSYDVHMVWLNREALDRIGVQRSTQRLPFGNVARDARTGAPTGLLEDFATLGLSEEGQAALGVVIPSYAPQRRYAALRRNLEAAARFGITTVVEPQAYLSDLPMYARARDEGILRSRLQIALFHRRGTGAADLDRFAEAMRRFDDDRLRVAAIKLYIDDVIEPHTAAMLESYSDRPGERGDTLYPPEEFAQVVTGLDRRGFQLFIHAIGDRGIRVALDALQRARDANGARDSRHQLVHVECIEPSDVPRFHALGVVACMQPRHCAPDITGQWARSVGPDRSRHAWAFRSLHEADAVLAFASDWNVAEMDPMAGLYTALTRRGLDGQPAGGWIPEQTIDLETALRAYTIQGAWANHLEASRGSLAPGKYADIVMLDRDLFSVPPEEILKARAVLTLVGGEEVWRDVTAIAGAASRRR